MLCDYGYLSQSGQNHKDREQKAGSQGLQRMELLISGHKISILQNEKNDKDGMQLKPHNILKLSKTNKLYILKWIR